MTDWGDPAATNTRSVSPTATDTGSAVDAGPSIDSENDATGYLNLADKCGVDDGGRAMSNLDPTDRPDGDAIEAAADEAEVGREELLKRALVALAEAEGIDVPDAEEVAAIRRDLDDLKHLDAEVDEKVGDLRDRFVDLYQKIESKAPADHAHEETESRLDALATDVDAVAGRLDTLESDVDATATAGETLDEIDGRLAGIESRIDDLDALASRVDDLGIDELDEKLSRVASAVVRVRRRLEAAERDRADRERIGGLTATANRHGVRKANCTNCGETVDIGLLTAPECPHCGDRFAELEPNPGFLGTSKLVVEEAPALDGDVSEGGSGPEDGNGRSSTGTRETTARDDTGDRGGV